MEHPTGEKADRLPGGLPPGSPAPFPCEVRESRWRYPAGFLAAAAIHLGILFGVTPRQPPAPLEPPEFGVIVAETGVEVTLVAALPAEVVDENAPLDVPVEEPEEPVEEPAEEEPEPEPEPEPQPEPEPEPEPVTKPEVIVPKPTPQPTPVAKPKATPAATPKPRATPRPQRPARPARPARVARVSGDGSSAIPGQDTTSASAGGGALSSKPGYLRNPHPSYPEEARQARQEGVVHLRVNVDERGRVAGVTISRSSGHRLLDERARDVVSQRWTFRPARRGNTPVATVVVIPIRFSLRDR